METQQLSLTTSSLSVWLSRRTVASVPASSVGIRTCLRSSRTAEPTLLTKVGVAAGPRWPVQVVVDVGPVFVSAVNAQPHAQQVIPKWPDCDRKISKP